MINPVTESFKKVGCVDFLHFIRVVFVTKLYRVQETFLILFDKFRMWKLFLLGGLLRVGKEKRSIFNKKLNIFEFYPPVT